MRISRRLRRVDVSNDAQFENMRRRLLLEDLEADIKAKRATEQAMKSQTATQEQIRYDFYMCKGSEWDYAAFAFLKFCSSPF